MIKKKIAIIGLGYVRLPLAVAFSKKFKVIGFDINNNRIQELKNGHDHTLEVEDHLLSSVSNNLSYSFLLIIIWPLTSNGNFFNNHFMLFIVCT